MPSRTSLLSVGGSSSPPFPSTYLGEGDIIPHVMDTQKGSYNPSKLPTRSSRTYSVPVEGPIGPPYYNTCHSEGDIIPLAPVTQKGINCSSTHPISYCKVRNTPQSVATALGHVRTPRKLDATRRDDAMSSHMVNISNFGSTTLESRSLPTEAMNAEIKYRSMRNEASQMLGHITCEQQRESLKTEAR